MENTNASEVLFQVLKSFSEINEQFNVAFKATEKQKTLKRCEKNDLHVHYIARNILTSSEYCENVIDHFHVLLPRLVSIAINFDDKFSISSHRQHLRNCILLGKLIRKRPDLAWYATKYCEKSPSPFSNTEQIGGKKQRMSENLEVSDLEFVEACYSLLSSNPNFFRKKWNWSEFLEKYLNNTSNLEIQWISCHCLAIVTSMNESQLTELIKTKMTLEHHEQFTCKFDYSKTLQNASSHSREIDNNPCISLNKNHQEEITEISGIYIPKLFSSDTVSVQEEESLIMVDSTCNNLRKIALGLTDGGNKAICLQGPVGSGKTSLIEHLAKKTGRKLGENFIKVQLGDQTDSKMLLGTYRCTDIPGEFVWQPGVVTQAVIEGNWLLLEDVDSASVDIASVLSSLLENGSLTVPGYRDSLDIAPRFQIFFTQRLVSTITGLHKKHSNSMTLLEKHLLQVNITPLSSSELKTIVIKRHPQFTTIADRMLSVFLLFSNHPSNASEITIPKTSRLISTRDFFKWCTRAAIDFDISSQSSALKVLQDAIDVFCCSFPKQDDALQLARQISTHLGIINEKAAFFFKSYKPNLQISAASLTVGRASIKRNNEMLVLHYNYFFTRPSSVLLERVMCCVNLNEPVLLVGETGTGKTSSVQYLANTIGQKLIVINMNQQSDSADLLGGFKPVDLKFVINPVRKEFESVFCDFFNIESNKLFLSHIAHCFNRQRWSDLVTLMTKSYESALSKLAGKENEKSVEMRQRWILLGEKLHKLSLQLKQKTALAFAFIEGSLVKAVEQGCWVLLDEINLANAETLECLSGLLEGKQSSLCLLERGDKQPVKRHANFTLFACMNPSTDVGKKDLPPGLRNRFTEFFVDELTERNDLHLLVGSYLNSLSLKEGEISKIVEFYLRVRRETETSLSDGLGHKPHFSLRSLCRALTITARNPCGMFKKSLYEAFCLSFLTQLDSASYNHVQRMIGKFLVGEEKLLKSLLKQPIPQPRSTSDHFLQFEGYWIRKGNLETSLPENYILTPSVRKNLKDLVRIVSIGSLPVLLQGDTSVGKTSLITFLAKSSGNKCVRINNHEHTDLQEYIGSYIADASGKLVFREGLLVEAMRQGHWIILDELNLAPSDVLEALNRVLDDNRELFIPETQETVKANENFMLFATQNPPGSYGGRKMLSRAFRNRFVELHFNEIPPAELEVILHKRCAMAPSYASKMILVMTELQMRRRGSAAFAGKQGFMTLRDLFRWGERYRLAHNTQKLYDWDQHLADEGYLVLAGRVRKLEEKNEIISVLEKILKRNVDPNNLFTLSEKTSAVTRGILQSIAANKAQFRNIVFTYSMRQLVVLVAKAFEFQEPVLLVGETGGGKTTVCKLIADQNCQNLTSVNCHMHTESSDFIGGLRPVRDHSNCEENKLFEWVDGPLIRAMQNGDIFLADEISLADDSVLERLNSLLEPERTLLLAEKGHDLLIQANPKFYFIGTMNPGGDFGKKELSPALRNRFTEIWCEQCTARCDLIDIIEENIQERVCMGNQQDGSTGIGKNIMDFIEWFKMSEIGKRITVSIRDILTWVEFINKTSGKVDIFEAYHHGACLTFLDALGTGLTSCESSSSLEEFRQSCEKFLRAQTHSLVNEKELVLEEKNGSFGIHPFFIETSLAPREKSEFSFKAPTTLFNTLRLLRGMQLHKAILLEGSPGVGKTSLVTALAKNTGHRIFRVNLSDQTDISDLFGADLPVEGGKGGQFSWRDGPLLQALQAGDWILLDELNLASQSVLEGLNACLDHRGEVYIPELGKTFQLKEGTRFFACQNPQRQGGARRGLPQSFLNRFIQVYVAPLTRSDLGLILKKQFEELPEEVLEKMLEFNARVVEELEKHSFGNRGGPWELNLRDLTRWCEATLFHFRENTSEGREFDPGSLVELMYSDRMRSGSDRERIREVFAGVFGREVSGRAPVLYVNSGNVFVGDVSVDRDGGQSSYRKCESFVLRTQLAPLRSLAYCVNLNWMSLLVGGSASGKSAIVKVLANLAGKSLRTLPVTSAMDTTDILGGFEQTDYARHLEEIVKETERVLFENVRGKLLKNERKACCELLALWESYRKMENDLTNRTMEEEAQLFTKKLHKLQQVWNVLPQTQKLVQKSVKILDSVEREKSLNAGGKFEWIDSVLIKCLQDGSWLLVDNVNLCSAAVLDRLNALLEPNGVLTVSERGVDATGRMIEVKPHPQFRLFLTMDPKNGEISRAMRNRGVEIFLLAETESNTFDLKTLISREGLAVSYIDPLLTLHNFVSGLVLGEKPNVTELLRAARLTAKQLQNGYTLSRAFHSSLMEIYAGNRGRVEFSCDGNEFSSALMQEIERVLCDGGNGDDKEERNVFFADSVTVKTDALQKCSRLEQIKQQSTFLVKHFDRNNSLELISDTLCYFFVHFYSTGSRDELHVRHLYVMSRLQHQQDSLRVLAENLKVSTAEKSADFVRNFPLDPRWIPETNFAGRNELKSNVLVLSLHFVASLAREQSNSLKIEKEMSGKRHVSLREYMKRRKTRKIDDQFDDVLVEKMHELLDTFNEFIRESLENISELTDEQVVRILEMLSWRFVFHRCTLVNVRKISTNQRHAILTSLKVHYCWFLKHSVNSFKSLINSSRLSKKLEGIVREINKSLENEFSQFSKFAKTFQKRNAQPLPLTSTEKIEFFVKLNKLMRDSSICNKQNNPESVISTLLENPELRQELIQGRIDGKELSFEEFPPVKTQINKYQFDLIPIIDCFLKLSLRRNIFKSESSEELQFRAILPVDLIAAIELTKRDKRYEHELTSCFFGYLLNSISVKNLSCFNPILVNHVTNLLISEESRMITANFGNFQELSKQQVELNQILWLNCQQLQREDFLATEIKIIAKSFTDFVSTLASSLNIEKTEKNLPEKCLAQLAPLETDAKELNSSFLAHFRNCIANFTRISENEDFNTKIQIVGEVHMELSYVKAVLNSRLALIDPSAKKTLRKKYCSESLASFERLQETFASLNQVFSGSERTLHSHYSHVGRMIEQLEAKNAQLGVCVAVRPETVPYEDVAKSVNHGFDTILSPKYIDRLVLGLSNAIKTLLKKEESGIVLNQYESCVSSFENLICEWEKYRCSYPDVIEPLLSNVTEFLYGFKLNLGLLKRLLAINLEGDAQTRLVQLVQLPGLDQSSQNYQFLIDSYTDRSFFNLVDAKHDILRLSKCGIQESFNNCVIEANTRGGMLLTGKIFSQFESLIASFVAQWNQQEADREKHQQEADSLYKTKTKCDDKTEEEQIASELKELFPNYHEEDFADMQKKPTLNSLPLPQTPSNEFSGVIGPEDIKFVVDLHLILLQSFTRTEWLNPGKNTAAAAAATPNFVNPLVEKFKVFKLIFNKQINGLDYKMNTDLFESLSVLLNYVQNSGDINLLEVSSPTRSLSRNRYDFYKDSNVEEVMSAFYVLEALKKRISELLEDWPDQPTLKSIVAVIERVYSFDVASPLARFLTAFEILLSKCHEWEEVAHSGVSLSEHSQSLIQQIITWRKIELSVWKDLLNTTFQRLNEPIYKFWLFLYNIMEQYTRDESITELELIETLQNYVSKSNLAEFQNRLRLLHAFHCHAVHLERTNKSKSFISILWNVYCYFEQFAANVANKIKDLRAPIEKKLRDYVKIVKWKDVNYWSIKETVEKTHKTLHKYVREFQGVLRMNVSAAGCLVNTPSGSKSENVGIWDRPQRREVKTYHYTLDPETYICKDATMKRLSPRKASHKQLLHKIDGVFVESRKLCKEAMSAMKYPKLVQSLDGFVTEIIETSSHLQNLDVDTTLEKKKQKSQAKSILNRKHRALADLFKSLTKIGISYKSGLVQSKLKMGSEEFLMKPIDISANFSHIDYKRKDEKILTIWDSCEMYYLKSLMRADVLHTALNTPAPDLGLQNIERCRGFSSNLLTLVQRQKAQLKDNSITFYYLRHYTTQMARISESKHVLPLSTVETIENFIKNVTVTTAQTKIFLNTCPVEPFGEVQAVFVLQPQPKFIQHKNDEMWSRANALISDIQSLANKIAVELEKARGDVPSVEFNLIKLKYVPIADLSGLQNKFNEIHARIIQVVEIFGQIRVARSFAFLSNEVENIISSFKHTSEGCESDFSVKKLQKLTSSLSSTIFEVIQQVSVKYTSNQEESLQEIDEETSLEEEHLRKLIVENLEKDLKELDMFKILELCHRIAKILFVIPPHLLDEPKSLISFILPLLEQVMLFYQYVLTQQVSAYRVSCKLSSILLNIFIDLASKGFCVPPELLDEEQGVGKATDGMGLGEGQGERDVSDKIESEDQLEDAQPAGQEKEQKDEDPDCREEEKGIEMSEDFDSKLQDLDKKGDEEESEDEDENSDADEQMGETEKDASKKDKETFGSEDEEDEEMGEEQGEKKEEKGEGGEKEGESELAAKEKDKAKNNDENDKDSGREKEENKKEINEMEEPEFDDEQTDPYHGNQPELPEPEAMDLPDDLQLDDGQEKENDGGENEENPFDIDAMKEDNPFDDKKEDEKQGEEKNDEAEEFSSDDEDANLKQDEDEQNSEEQSLKENKTQENEAEEASEDVSKTEEEKSGLDQTQTNEDHVEAMQVDENSAADKTENQTAPNQKSNQSIEDLCQEDKPDKDGVGQSQMEESSTGHSAQASTPQETQSAKREREEEKEKPQKIGDSDSQRALGNVDEPVKKKLKTVDTKEDENSGGEEESEEKDDEAAEMYKHIKESSEKASDTQILDVATKEQAEKQEVVGLEEEEKEETSPENVLEKEEDEEEQLESTDAEVQKAEKLETEKAKKKSEKKQQHPDGDVLEEIQEVEVEGEVIETMTVQRGFETTHHTLYDNLKAISAARLTQEEMNSIRKDVELQLSAWNETPSDAEADRTWQKISSVTLSLAQDLSEQLRLVLEPTLASRLKGDFRTGRRINMRKVIPYIASQFRKDKIWLRRTKPSKREYQIVLAIDDSSSMSDNHSKELAFESVALISKALTLLESGQLSVVSFGESTEILHRLTDQFTERSGVKLLQKFRFDQNKTCVAKLVDFVNEMLDQSQMQSSSALNARLLVVVSDGRGVFSEGEAVVRQAVRRAKLCNVFMVFVIIDNPENKHSILDIRMPVFKDGRMLNMQNYMDVFPFSFYIVLRDINSLPSVLSDALRQWFEVVSNLDKQ